MKKTINYEFNLPQLLDSAFILKYNENIVEIDRLLKEWKNIVDIEVSDITNNIVQDINADIKELEEEIYVNKSANNVLTNKITQLYKMVNNENNFLMNYFEPRFITIENNISNMTIDVATIKENYDNLFIEVTQQINKVDTLESDNQTINNELDTMVVDLSSLTEDINKNDDRLEIFRTKLINFVNINSDTFSLGTDDTFSHALDAFLKTYREV